MAKPPKFTPHTWQDQKDLLEEGRLVQESNDGVKGFFILAGLGAAVLAVVGLAVYSIWGVFR